MNSYSNSGVVCLSSEEEFPDIQHNLGPFTRYHKSINRNGKEIHFRMEPWVGWEVHPDWFSLSEPARTTKVLYRWGWLQHPWMKESPAELDSLCNQPNGWNQRIPGESLCVSRNIRRKSLYKGKGEGKIFINRSGWWGSCNLDYLLKNTILMTMPFTGKFSFKLNRGFRIKDQKLSLDGERDYSRTTPN